MKTREGTVPCEGCGEPTADSLGPFGYLCDDCEAKEYAKARQRANDELYGPME